MRKGEHERQRKHDHIDEDLHHAGLTRDLALLKQGLLSRRQILRLALGAGLGAAALPALIPLVGCGSAGSAGCPTTIPEETAGPYPGDGSNGPNLLSETGVVRSDIRSSIGSL